ncbi:ATP-binding protein [Streptomyces sp. SCSIO ZS0520]|uniref:ATP-binding protein n=1 Tax=Streptomyces sp. SCSIO ZS0520 TaxID=2892996 RepID=UPI0039876733
MDAAPERVRQVRRITVAEMERWAVPPPLAEDVQLVVSALLTNAVLHSGADEVTLTLRFIDGLVRIDVHDPGGRSVAGATVRTP